MRKSAWIAGPVLLCCGMAFASVAATPEGPVGSSQQAIIAGDPVDAPTQKNLSLVTVDSPAGTCSGTLLNRYWVLTADHCVSTDGKIGGPLSAMPQLRVSAAWDPANPQLASYVRRFNGTDIALIHLGEGDFGPVPQKILASDAIDNGVTVRAFGRGRSVYANPAATPPTPATGSGYRSADLVVSNVSEASYTYSANSRSQILMPGDSGGPDYQVNPDGSMFRIVGVHSNCGLTMTPPNAGPAFTTNVGTCTNAPVWPLFLEITEASRTQYAQFCRAYANEAMTQTNLASQQSCPVDGRFSPNKRDHIGWCMAYVGANGYDGAKNQAMREALARKATLDQCRLRDNRLAIEARRLSTVRPSVATQRAIEPSVSVADAGAAATRSCKSGYVWRKARPEDLVCVLPEARTRVQQENQLAEFRWDPSGALARYGKKTCIEGYVWRDAFADDKVCVIPDSRDLVKAENRFAAANRQTP